MMKFIAKQCCCYIDEFLKIVASIGNKCKDAKVTPFENNTKIMRGRSSPSQPKFDQIIPEELRFDLGFGRLKCFGFVKKSLGFAKQSPRLDHS